MDIIKTILNHYQKKADNLDAECNEIIFDIDKALDDAKDIFSSTKAVAHDTESKWRTRHSDILTDISKIRIQKYRFTPNYEILSSKQSALIAISNSMTQQIQQHNERIAAENAELAYILTGEVEGHKLDSQQMLCIAKEAHNHLVIAGAGTGKTTTVIGKIKYLINSGKFLPKDILVLSFTNASAAEMSKRITAETGCSINALTFHKLGLNIISRVNGVMPKITQINLRKFIKEQLSVNMQSDDYLILLSSYFLYNRNGSRSEFEFKTQQEYDEYIKLNPPTTLNNELVKSYGEMEIANFLIQNGIRYIYESPYEIDTRTTEYGQYHPDFYLPDYDIYIEYFGINRKGEVPSYFKPKGDMTASEAYRTSIYWKRALHKKHHTTMIECYAYEKSEGTLLQSLQEKLINASVAISSKADTIQYDEHDDYDSLIDGMVELFETLINLIKSNGYTVENVRKLNHEKGKLHINDILLSLLEPIFDSYCQQLSSNNEIDFNDMINLASKYVRQGKYVNPYKYVIVDEYQDISKARFNLLKCLRESSDYDLFCVGDDWQSIYRFAGSDIGFILNFSDYCGETETSRIETTYRFPQKLIEISSGFIMQNPAQIQKCIHGRDEDIGFPLGEICGYTDKFAIDFTAKKLDDIPDGSDVLFIGRYSFDVNLLNDSGLFTCRYNNISGFIDVKLKSRPDLKMTFMTAHKSKGLQADYVFIINNKKSKMGFPSKIQDAPILELLLDNYEQYPYAEERRLFYVALTRAKKKAFILTVEGKESEFAAELKLKYGDELQKERFECPLCGGMLVKRSGPYGEFFGCSNYRINGCTFKRKI